jgi:predicted nucleic acid-binding protein
MTHHILLDSTPLGLLSSPIRGTTVLAIEQWSRDLLHAGHKIYIPEVIDYELRRELIRAIKTEGLAKLDGLKRTLQYLPITTQAILRAADLWAYSRRAGIPTGDPKKLDIDVIVCAQALTLDVPPAEIIVATVNVDHISRFVPADLWNNIGP